MRDDYTRPGVEPWWAAPQPDLPEGWVLDPGVTEHRPEIGVWWVILPDGTRTAWNGVNHLICHICTGGESMADCSLCKGRGRLDNVPFADRPWDEVVPGLWLGGHDCQPSAEVPDGNCYPDDSFHLVVSLYRRPGFDPPEVVEHVHHRMADADLDPEHHTRLDTIAESVAHAVNDGCKVLVRCQAGINRSALVTGLAMLQLGWTANDAIQRMREVRSPYVLFNKSFTDHLHETERRNRDG